MTTTYQITKEIAKGIIASNDAEYLTWADCEPITAKELQKEFNLEIVGGSLQFIPKFNLVHKVEDFSLNNVLVVPSDGLVNCHFNQLNPTKVQYVYEGILLQESYADTNDIADLQELAENKEPLTSKEEHFFGSYFQVKNNKFSSPF